MKIQITMTDSDLRLAVKLYLEDRGHKVTKVEQVVRPGSPGDGPHPATPPSVEYVAEVESPVAQPQGAARPR